MNELYQALSVLAGGTGLCTVIVAGYAAAAIFAAVMTIMTKSHARRAAAAHVLGVLTRRSACSCGAGIRGAQGRRRAPAPRRSTARRGDRPTNR